MAKITVIGCGTIGSAFTMHWAKDHQVSVIEKNPSRVDTMQGKVQVFSLKEIKKALLNAEIVLLAIKPQDLSDSASKITPFIPKNALMISVLAGTSTTMLADYFPDIRLMRLIPNNAIVQQQGVIGMVEPEEITPIEKKQLETLLHPFGLLHWLPEDKIDAFTVLTSCNPAYLFTIMETMLDAGVHMGLSAHEALPLLLQTWKGVVAMLSNTKKHPGELKWQVTSPAGMTIAGVRALEKGNLRSAIFETLLAAYDKGLNLHVKHHQ
ncbi:MAG: pyrroline-5-carboxylate reductase [Parachlamydiales bacterium]|nr:pyrroline-5-carboxylate reductase [Parachlamydiales bacterium]